MPTPIREPSFNPSQVDYKYYNMIVWKSKYLLCESEFHHPIGRWNLEIHFWSNIFYIKYIDFISELLYTNFIKLLWENFKTSCLFCIIKTEKIFYLSFKKILLVVVLKRLTFILLLAFQLIAVKYLIIQ